MLNPKKFVIVFIFASFCLGGGFTSAEIYHSVGVSLGDGLKNYYEDISNKETLNGIHGKAQVDSLFEKSLELVEANEIMPMVNAIQKTRSYINTTYNCDIQSSDLQVILYHSNKGFQRATKTILGKDEKIQYPNTAELINACVDFNVCKLNFTEDKDILKSLKYVNSCKNNINIVYERQYAATRNISTMKQVNYGTEIFWNNSLEDSSYDIMHDINNIAKLLFEQAKEAPELLFYRLPTISIQNGSNTNNGGGNNINQDNYDGTNIDRFSPRDPYDFLDEEPGEDNVFGEVDNIVNYIKIIGNVSDENERIYSPNTTTNNETFGNFCIDGIPFPYEALCDDCVDTTYDDTDPLNIDQEVELDDYIYSLLDDNDNLACNNDGKCNSFEGKSCDDCSQQAGDAISSSRVSVRSIQENGSFAQIDSLKACLNSCEDLSCGVTKCDKVVCIARCTCQTIESPALNINSNVDFKILEEGALKIRFCFIPPSNTPFHKSKVSYSIEEILNETHNLLISLRDSGQLSPQNKTREFLDTAHKKYNKIDKQSDFSMEVSSKKSFANPSSKTAREIAITQNKRLQSEILGMQSDLNDLREKNKYVVIANHSQLKAMQTNIRDLDDLYTQTQLNEEINTLGTDNNSDYQEMLRANARVAKNNLMLEFLNHNAQFRYQTKGVFESFKASTKLFVKKR